MSILVCTYIFMACDYVPAICLNRKFSFFDLVYLPTMYVCLDGCAESVSPERNLVVTCWYHVGEILKTINKVRLLCSFCTNSRNFLCWEHSVHNVVLPAI